MTELGDLRPELCEGMIEARTIPAGGDETGAPIPAPQANGESSVQGAASMLLNQDFLASYDGSAAADATYDSCGGPSGLNGASGEMSRLSRAIPPCDHLGTRCSVYSEPDAGGGSHAKPRCALLPRTPSHH